MSAGNAHRLALLQKWESQLNPAQLEVWRRLMELLPKDSPLVGERGSWGLECALMSHVKRGATVEQIIKARLLPKHPKQQMDLRMLAANDE